ncbi:Imm8 family immunity protein [Spartinivicinus poritis]|uniref:Imm8 family immunity protein n=1 Tax=Spartinivicinus poritis TaxID=2994640 RepID=A0ABT5U3W8_9GAMM|nr:Imm8 family immunity protein [Spartinivicinus sp. A2-2]MDE1461051.1 Imm8 family immunity protein [Spartinivicinus sp. A2-2]
MKPIIKSVFTWDHVNIRTWEPINPNVIAETVYIDIGPDTKKRADSFSIRVATPAGLSNLEVHEGVIATRPLLIIDSYDYDNLWAWLVKTVKSCESNTWNASVEKLRLHFDWEYD